MRRYVMKPRWRTLIASALFFGIGAVVLGARGAGNDRALIIDGIIRLGARGATAFYWTLAVLSLLFVAATAMSALHYRGGRRALVIDDGEMRIPGPIWRASPRVVRFDEIRGIRITRVSGQEIATIVHVRGRPAIARSLVGDEAFAEILALLAERTRPEASLPEARVRS